MDGFLRARCGSLVFSDRMVTPLATETLSTPTANTSSRSTIHDCAIEPLMSTERGLLIGMVSTGKYYTAQTNTFSNWPLVTPNTREMSDAGWWYTNVSSRVLCLFCDAIFHEWTESDLPYEVHRHKSPACPFVRLTDSKMANPRQSAIKITSEPETQGVARVLHTRFKDTYARTATFACWPHTEQTPLPAVDLLVNAGFFYTGSI